MKYINARQQEVGMRPRANIYLSEVRLCVGGKEYPSLNQGISFVLYVCFASQLWVGGYDMNHM